MTIRKIAQLGHPVLRRKAHEVSEDEMGLEGFTRLIDDLTATMRDAGGVGIAAPQVHALRRVFAMEVRDDNRYGITELLALTIVVNPRIQPLSSRSAVHWEGCLSMTGLRGPVSRNQDILLAGIDVTGAPIEHELHDFPAIVAQHELDHLDGCLFIDRIKDLRLLSFEREYRRFHELVETEAGSFPREELEQDFGVAL